MSQHVLINGLPRYKCYMYHTCHTAKRTVSTGPYAPSVHTLSIGSRSAHALLLPTCRTPSRVSRSEGPNGHHFRKQAPRRSQTLHVQPPRQHRRSSAATQGRWLAKERICVRAPGRPQHARLVSHHPRSHYQRARAGQSAHRERTHPLSSGTPPTLGCAGPHAGKRASGAKNASRTVEEGPMSSSQAVQLGRHSNGNLRLEIGRYFSPEHTRWGGEQGAGVVRFLLSFCIHANAARDLQGAYANPLDLAPTKRTKGMTSMES